MGINVALAVSSVFAVAGGVLLAIAFGTNNWYKFTVQQPVQPSNQGPIESYYTRTLGLFRMCFPDQQLDPADKIPVYKDPLGFRCVDINYADTIDDNMPKSEKEYIHMKRLFFAFYIVGLALTFVAILFLIAGCGKHAAVLIWICAFLLLLAAAFVGASMGVWHYAFNLASKADFPTVFMNNENSWNDALKRPNTTGDYSWSYIVSWVGVGCLVLASFLMCISGCVIKRFKRNERNVEKAQAAYYAQMGPYSTLGGAGGASGASPMNNGAAYDKSMSSAAVVPYGYMNYGYNTYSPYSYNPYAAYYSPYYMQYYSMQR